MTAPRRQNEPLPFAARQALWSRLWDRLLAPPPDAPPPPGPDRTGRPADPLVEPGGTDGEAGS